MKVEHAGVYLIRGPNGEKPHIHKDQVWIARIGNRGGIYANTFKELREHWLSVPRGWQNWHLGPTKLALDADS